MHNAHWNFLAKFLSDFQILYWISTPLFIHPRPGVAKAYFFQNSFWGGRDFKNSIVLLFEKIFEKT